MPPGGTWAKPREKSEEQLIQTGQETAASAKALWQEALGAVTRGWKSLCSDQRLESQDPLRQNLGGHCRSFVKTP